jgi:hypothetical protein
MNIKEGVTSTKYLFTSPLFIDDSMNVSTDTTEYDSFRLLLDRHDITDYKQSQVVDGKNEIVVAVEIDAKYLSQDFEYDLLTLLMRNKLGK